MKTRKERTSRGYLERSTKAVYKQLPHSKNMAIKKELPFFHKRDHSTASKMLLVGKFPWN